jgi:flavodoxin/Pyruvate/2-oxoacid:ferredoxin oxidoreductase delta subunit
MERILKKILLILFSGTGNTLHIAKMIQSDFEARGCQADIFDISSPPSNINLDDYDFVGLGYPIYAFNAPKIFFNAIKKMKFCEKSVFIFKTSGEPCQINNSSSHDLIKMIGKKNVLGDYHFLMPYNILFRFPDSLVKQMLLSAKKYSRVLVSNILEEKKSFIDYNFLNVVLSFLLKIQQFGAFVNSKLYHVKKSKCTLCLKCVKECLAGNISLQEKNIRFGFSCQMCMRCSYYCPADAIRIGLLNPWKVNGAFNFDSILHDDKIASIFITEKVKGFYRPFKNYFKKLDFIQSELHKENG